MQITKLTGVIYIGVCYKNFLENKYYSSNLFHKIDHGCYLFSFGGHTYSHHSKFDNHYL